MLIPPEEIWGPIQAIRRKHDRQARRWMPHVTLLYPFVEPALFDDAEEKIRKALQDFPPFTATLETFREFHHGKGRFTLWLAPEPAGPMAALQSALQSALPECDEVSRFAQGFTPHLSVGQALGREETARIRGSLQEGWQPLRFEAHEVCFISRDPPPRDIFHVARTLSWPGKSRDG